MTLNDSFNDYHAMRDLLEELCQEMYNDLNDGKPSPVLRYVYLQEAKKLVEGEPYDDAIVQSLMLFYINSQLSIARLKVSVKTIKFEDE